MGKMTERTMKIRIIKKNAPNVSQPAVKEEPAPPERKTTVISIVSDWVSEFQNRRRDPAQAFAALFN